VTRVPGLVPRFAAWRILHDVRHGVPFDVALRRAVRDLEPDDRRLAHELAAGVFRSRTELDAALKPAVARGIGSVRADTLDALRLGAFQLLRLDKVPPHAAVQTTVGVARRLGGRRVAGFVNAVLRRLAEAAPSDAEHAPPTAELGAPATRLAASHSHPHWLVDRWLARFGEAATERLLTWNNSRPPLVLQPARWTTTELEAALDRAGVRWTRAAGGGGIAVAARRPTELPGYGDGGFFVQDPSQAVVARFLDPPAWSVIYDACAAPGGKSLALGRHARLVIAADRQRVRVRRLVENLRRAGTGPIAVILAEASRPPIRSADAVVLDVPCTGTGTLARNPDARWRITWAALESLARQAGAFLDAAANVVAPGGLLLFATCSLEPEENELQTAAFLARDRRFRREPSSAVPAELLTPDGDLMILPHRHGMDGAFAARLRRVAV
jgi:16S rRNA (cytosine967-C5)-methyltransferase